MIETLLILNFCHWAADYTHLSTKWMLSAKRFGKPLKPILAHATVHAILFGLAVTFLHGFKGGLIAFSLQLPTHFLIDVWKGRMNVWFEELQKPTNIYHWWVFGADQYLHQAVIIATTYFICC